ncbi:MAG: type III pantothenate kinase [Pyrinomonadaceae bacterium]
MLLAVDIGNTNIKFGLYAGENLVQLFRTPTRQFPDKAAGSVFAGLSAKPTRALICSVVPEANASVAGHIRTELNCTSTFVSNDTDLDLEIRYEPLTAAGTDRLINSFSAAERYGAPCIVCSFGTALTIDAIDQDRVLKGGLIAPGMSTMAKALNFYTSKLPEVSIEKPTTVIQNDTVGSIRSGIVYGYFGLATSLIERVKQEMVADAKVIATGGFARMIAENTDCIDIVDENLLLDGLMRLHRRLS